MVYFSSASVPPDDLDHNQYERLKEFKEYCKTQGIIGNYKDIAEFRENLYNHLVRTVQNDEYCKTIISTFAEASAGTNTGSNEPHLSRGSTRITS